VIQRIKPAGLIRL